jgi:phosphoribosyl-dephospho-CoA transferase
MVDREFLGRMGATVHDLLRVRGSDALVNRDPAPGWVNEALSRAPWVVVRRAPAEGKFIPVGVRGRNRGERFASFVHRSSIVECLRPENLSSSQAWKKAVRFEELPAMSALLRVEAIFQDSDLHWGPSGSVGFELASGVPIAVRTSDLDLIVRMSDLLIPPSTTRKLLAMVERVETTGVRVDLLLETRKGAMALLEYARGGTNLLLRTIHGPRLIPHPQRESVGNGGRQNP